MVSDGFWLEHFTIFLVAGHTNVPFSLQTAAHCVQSQGGSTSNLVVRVGEHDLVRQEKYSRDYSIEKLFLHPNYSKMSSYKNWVQINNADIALLKTADDIHWSEYAWPVCIPPANLQLPGQDAIVIGWGKLREKSELYSELLQKVKLTIIDGTQCAQWFKQAGRDLHLSPMVLCAGFVDGGRDACHGKSPKPSALYGGADNIKRICDFFR